MAVSASSLNPYFTGMVIQHEYARQEDFEFIPNYTSVTDQNGVTTQYVSSYTRNLVTAHVVEQSFRFEGLNYEMAHTKVAQTVTDASGATWTVPMENSWTDGSHGSRVFEKESVEVTREPMSPHMWVVTVVRRGTRYKLNGTSIINPPTWAADIV